MARYPNGPSRYDNCKNSDLQHMLKNRGIQHTGNKARLIERLKLDDRVR